MNESTPLVASSTINVLAACATLCFVLPILLLVALKKNTRQSLRGTFYGVIIYFSFTFGFQQIFNMLFLLIDSPVSRFLGANGICYCIYNALVVAGCEETGRLIAFRFLKNEGTSDKRTSLMYGAGHGGAECIMNGAFPLVTSLLFASTLNMHGYDAFIHSGGEETLETYIAYADSLMFTSAGMYLLSVVERMICLAMQFALSILMYEAVSYANKKLTLLTYIFHFVFALPALLLSYYTENAVAEAVAMGVITAGIFAFAMIRYKKLSKTGGD